LISNIVYKHPKQYARRLSKENIKSNVDTFLRLRYVSKLGKDDRRIFYPYDVRKNIPDDLKEIKNIQAGDMRRILMSLRRTNVIVSKVDKDEIAGVENTRRRSSKDSYKPPGVKSPYQIAQFYSNMEKLLTKSNAIDLIHHLLLESGMLYKYIKHTQLTFLYIVKLNHDKDKAWNICKSIFPMLSTESDFDRVYSQTHSADNFRDSRKMLEELASNRSRLVIENCSPAYFIDLYKIGGQAFQA